jgi:hypothetical protein
MHPGSTHVYLRVVQSNNYYLRRPCDVIVECISRFVQTSTYGARFLSFYCSRFRFLSSSLNSSSCSSSLSAVSAGLRMCAILPLLVGGPELSLKRPVAPLSRGPPHDQLLRWSTVFPLEKGGVVGRELSVRPWEEAVVSE